MPFEMEHYIAFADQAGGHVDQSDYLNALGAEAHALLGSESKGARSAEWALDMAADHITHWYKDGPTLLPLDWDELAHYVPRRRPAELWATFLSNAHGKAPAPFRLTAGEEDKMAVANTILAQLGGNRFIAMTGAKDFVGGADSLSFRFPGSRDVNTMRIVLNEHDYYDVTFGRIRGSKYVVVQEMTDVPAENLQELFAHATGLATRL